MSAAPKPRPLSAFGTAKGPLIAVAVFSGVINVLALTGAIYMLQVYDRVLPSRSVPTLIGLSILMIALFCANGFLDLLRVRIMGRVGLRLDEALRDRVFGALQSLSLHGRGQGDGLQAVRDLDRLRAFFSGVGPTALFDLPWIPVYIALIFLLHPLLGWFAVAGAIFLVAITLATEVFSRQPSGAATSTGGQRLSFAGAVGRNAEAVRALGMDQVVGQRWRDLSYQHLHDHLRASDVVAGFGVLSKAIRLILQSAILGLGAYLVVKNEVSPGTIIAGSIVMSRALAPIETAIQHWRGFVDARQAHARLSDVLGASPATSARLTDLPAPCQRLDLDNVVVMAPGQAKPTLQGVSFSLIAGHALGVIGPSGSGKTTLARVLVGVWAPLGTSGSVRLDGATYGQWTAAALGRHLGYMPQDVQLFDGTVAENIARLDPNASSDAVVMAAQDAGSHDLILALPNGYQTRVGDNGALLSAGQRQRIALARALYGRPFLVVLDEPNANLDATGDLALAGAIRGIKDRGGIVIVIAHRPSALLHVDSVLALGAGKMQAFGPKDEVLRQVLAGPKQASPTDGTSSVTPLRRMGAETDLREPGVS
jgi:ATP-binding cassette, subfamily C, bacterial PrsD